MWTLSYTFHTGRQGRPPVGGGTYVSKKSAQYALATVIQVWGSKNISNIVLTNIHN